MLDSQVLAMTVWPKADFIKAPRNSTWILWSDPQNKQPLAESYPPILSTSVYYYLS